MRLYETECVKNDGPFRTFEGLELAAISWAHWSNEDWLHSFIPYRTSVERKNKHYREKNPGHRPVLMQLTLL